jgi:hypothetical protein
VAVSVGVDDGVGVAVMVAVAVAVGVGVLEGVGVGDEGPLMVMLPSSQVRLPSHTSSVTPDRRFVPLVRSSVDVPVEPDPSKFIVARRTVPVTGASVKLAVVQVIVAGGGVALGAAFAVLSWLQSQDTPPTVWFQSGLPFKSVPGAGASVATSVASKGAP